MSTPDKRPRWQQPPAPKIVRKRPGILMAALEFTEKASSKDPMTKDKLYELLLAKFPDYPNPESMKSTARRFEGWAPYYYKLHLHKSPKGFWVTKDYKGPFLRIAKKK